jgi:hypothetical protein
MRKRLSVVVAGLLAASALVIGSPAQAQPEVCDSTEPVLAYVCDTVEHYYWEAYLTAQEVYCKLNPPCR